MFPSDDLLDAPDGVAALEPPDLTPPSENDLLDAPDGVAALEPPDLTPSPGNCASAGCATLSIPKPSAATITNVALRF